MEKKKKIEHEVDKIIQCFDQPEDIEINPFLVMRVNAAIRDLENKQHEPGIFSTFEHLLRPAFIVGIIVVNLVTAGFIIKNEINQSTSKSQVLYSFAEEYSFTQCDYDILNSKDTR